MRALGVLLLAVALGLGWLSLGDRRSPLALSVVELDGKLGLPLAAPVGLLGLVLLALPRKKAGSSREPTRAPAARSPSSPPPLAAAPSPTSAKGEPPQAPSSGTPSLETQGWLAALSSQVARLPLEAGASVLLEPERAPPVQLILTRLTPERARRSVELFAELLATMPTPPRACVRYEGCVATTTPRNHQVVAAMRRYFSGEAFVVTQHEEVVELVFRAPDPRWRQAARAV